MVRRLDEGVGEVVAALREKDMLQDSIIVFLADNGAPTFGVHSNRGSNVPLRGVGSLTGQQLASPALRCHSAQSYSRSHSRCR